MDNKSDCLCGGECQKPCVAYSQIKMEMKAETVICRICGQSVKVRKHSNMGDFPVDHINPKSGQPCHGFYENGYN